MVNLNNINKVRKPRGNQKFNYVRFNMPDPLDKRRFYSAEIEGDGDTKIVYVELNQEEDEIIDFSDTCKCNTINAGMNKPLIMCKHIKDLIDLLIRIGRYKPKSI